MPITQERFMTVVLGAKHIIHLHRTVKDIVYEALTQDMANANSVLEHSPDDGAKRVVKQLLRRIQAIREAFIELRDTEVEELTAILLAEEIHFKKAERQNIRARYYQTKSRRERGIMPRAPEVELQRPIAHIPQTAEPITNVEDTKAFRDFQRKTHKKYWPKATSVAEEITHERKDNESIFGPLSLDIRAEKELELIREAQAARGGAPASVATKEVAPVSAEAQGYASDSKESALARVIAGGASYDKSVVSTSVPPLAELNKVPNTDEDVL